jgi:hypothetical protein
MNERIRELEAKCWDYGRGIVNTQKFAELIVRECAEVARLNTRVDSKVYLMIQEHFGIE